MSNSLPRTMRRKAAISGSTSMKSNSKVLGLTSPALSARLLPWLRVTVFSFGPAILVCSPQKKEGRRIAAIPRPSYSFTLMRSDGRLRDAELARQERVFGGFLERLVRFQHDRDRPHALVRGVDAGRDRALVGMRLGGPQHAVARHDDAVVGRNQVLLGAIADRPHAFLQRRILDRKAVHAAISLAGLLRGTIHQVVVILVGERPVRARHVFAMQAL